MSILQQISLKKFSQELALEFANFLCSHLHFQIKLVDFPELYVIHSLSCFYLNSNHSLNMLISSQQKNKSETLNWEFLKEVFKVLISQLIWNHDTISPEKFKTLLDALFHLLKYHSVLVSEENLLLLVNLLDKIHNKGKFLKETSIEVKKLLTKLTISKRLFPIFTLGLKLLIKTDGEKGIYTKEYYKCFKDFLYTTSEHVRKGDGKNLFYQNTLLRQAFELAHLAKSKPGLKKMFDLSNYARNFIFALMDDEQVLKRDVIRLIDEDQLVIEFNCSWDYCSRFLSHLRKLCDYTIAHENYLANEKERFNLKNGNDQKEFKLLEFVTQANLFELDTCIPKSFSAQPQQLTALNELVQVESQVITYPEKNVILVQLSIKNITKILVKYITLSITPGELQIYPHNIVIGNG
jgi:hypothetical protein